MYADRPGTAVTPFVRDDGHRATRTTPVALPAGAGRWTTVTRTVPEADPVGALGGVLSHCREGTPGVRDAPPR